MSKLYLVRHGESEWNIQKKVQGHEDIPLSSKGIKQAQQIADRLIEEEIHYIYSSDLIRAYETALVIGEKLKLEVNKVENLREINFGSWQGLTAKEISEKYNDEHVLWMTNPHKLSILGAETLLEVQERMIKTVKVLLDKHQDKNILIVSHGAAIKALILGILDIDLSSYNKLSINNVSLSIIEFRDYNPVLKLYNDISHTKEEKV